MDKRSIILNHYENPLNKEIPLDKNYLKVNSNNESCIDNIDIYILIEDEIIKDIKFEGEACVISISSTSIMIKNLINKTIEDALIYIEEFENMIEEKDYDSSILNEAIAYEGTEGGRKTCALLSYKGIKKLLNEQLK